MRCLPTSLRRRLTSRRHHYWKRGLGIAMAAQQGGALPLRRRRPLAAAAVTAAAAAARRPSCSCRLLLTFEAGNLPLTSSPRQHTSLPPPPSRCRHGSPAAGGLAGPGQDGDPEGQEVHAQPDRPGAAGGRCHQQRDLGTPRRGHERCVGCSRGDQPGRSVAGSLR